MMHTLSFIFFLGIVGKISAVSQAPLYRFSTLIESTSNSPPGGPLSDAFRMFFRLWMSELLTDFLLVTIPMRELSILRPTSILFSVLWRTASTSVTKEITPLLALNSDVYVYIFPPHIW